MNSKLLPILSVFLFLACDNGMKYKDAEAFSYGSFEERIPLQGRILPMEIISRPGGITCKDSILFVRHTNSDPLVSCFNMNTLQKTGDFIPFGSGPGELTDVWAISFQGNTVSIYTLNQKKILSYDIALFKEQQPVMPYKTIQMDKSTFEVLQLASGEILAASPEYADSRFVLFEPNGKFAKNFGTYPDIGQDLTPFEKFEAFNCNLTQLPNGNILLSYKNTDLLELYGKDLNLVKRLHGPDFFLPLVKQREIDMGTRVTSDKDSRSAYYSPNIVGDEIWIQYSGKLAFTTENGPYDYVLRDKVFVFDFNLNPKRIYDLDIQFYSLAVDSKNRCFYGIAIAPEFCIVKYEY